MLLTLTIAACVCTLLYIYRRSRMQVLEQLGVSVAGNPNVLFGSMLAFRGMTMRERFQSWTKQHGKTFGYYEGPRAVVVTSDLDLLQEVLVKQFSAFNGRKLFSLQKNPDNDSHVHMFFAQNERWKRLRMCANPAFSTAKMKLMLPTIHEDVGRFLKNMAANSTETEGFNIYEFYQRLTLDVIFECAFGVHINAQENPRSIYLTTIRAAFSRGKIPVVVILGIFLYECRALLRAVYGLLLSIGLVHNAFHDLGHNLVPKIVKMRYDAQQKSEQKDLIQLMLDAHHDDSSASSTKRPNGSSSAQSEITYQEVEAQINLFMLAGYETSSTTLAYCSYLLATHPEVQKRVQRDIDELIEKAETPDHLTYDDLTSSKLQYLEMVVLETLRLYPIAANVLSRRCMHDTEVRGMRFQRGTNIMPNVWSLHYDPELWGPEDPHVFEPERFSAERQSGRHSLAMLAFGGGPRTCIGMRFAMMEIKATLVRLLRDYSLCECTRTEKPLQLREMDVVTPKNGVFVRLEKRLRESS